ncbi:ADP-ribosylglycohydrolase family protein [Xylanimonas allomyrinae]|uniref:ADP-ribosylglycohydrolase family protein n=1 Tax=Xylanimonas allomyrinae TaxID=2509459 RepID=A0A4P6EXP0_9MICO|nr:ADP-ribosylglycohydrolase family protein [Xylanimonas allomyrinae]QAY62808.1 ADP-ribosylglycohydrolase family protein [Xylanimonas allomyrinae]
MASRLAVDAGARARQAPGLQVPLPFTLSAPLDRATFSATDDAEQAALAAAVLLQAIGASSGEPQIADIFEAWRSIVLPQADGLWGSVADRSAIRNAVEGLTPPATGTDNPHFYDDSSVARAVPVGIVYSGTPDQAARVARRLASVTNDGVGVDAAAAFASAIAVATSGGSTAEAVARAIAAIDGDSWLGRKLALAESILRESESLIDAIPDWNDQVANLEYNFGNIAAETLPLALIIARESASFAEAIGVANLMPKQADTMPAMVGSLLGAVAGVEAIPPAWRERVETLRGYGVPSTAGVRLLEVAKELVRVRSDRAISA